ncbi:hypothetical protein WN943_027430 [Citrus x changshan-huyou]
MEPYSRASRASEISLFVDTSTCAETPNNLSFLFFSFLFSPNIAAFFEEVQPKLQRPSVQRFNGFLILHFKITCIIYSLLVIM